MGPQRYKWLLVVTAGIFVFQSLGSCPLRKAMGAGDVLHAWELEGSLHLGSHHHHSTHGHFHLLSYPVLQSFTENWAQCVLFNSMTTEGPKLYLWRTFLTLPITYKFTTTSIQGSGFFSHGQMTENIWCSKSAHYICAENNYKKKKTSSWAFIWMKWTLSL